MSWQKRGINMVLNGPDFYISYNPNVNLLEPLFSEDDPVYGQETALVTAKGFRILNGDFRKEYEALVPKGLEACLAFFNSHKERYGSSWTDAKD